MNRLAAWFSRLNQACAMCGQPGRPKTRARQLPVRHPAPRKHLESLCGACREAMPWIVYPHCRVCGRGETCGDCARRTVRHYEACRCAVRYDDAMKDWLALYKYRGQERLGAVLAAMAAFALERLEDSLLADAPADPTPLTSAHPIFQAITSVPLSRERLAERGFNQAERIARHLSEWYRIPYRPLLRRVRHTEKQSLKSRRSRVTDMRGIFALEDTNAIAPPAGNILLLDDVYTTGSTMNECSRVLREASSLSTVYGITWAR
ncbi:ComF family protein [Cohnella sp. GCM10027633]|uniref:ComF family protein n=1 Tax=unclassified Cohnella TaxID=2636738 RepID=UPI00362D5B63